MNRIFYFILLGSIVALHSCKEILPTRTIQETLLDTTYLKASPSAAQDRKVLVEEFTGASCVNCPAGHLILHNIVAQHSDRIVTIGLHYPPLGEPVHDNGPKFILSESEDIAAAFGSSSMPSALIDRTKNGNSYVFSRQVWASQVDKRLAVPAKANIVSQVSYDSKLSTYILSLEIELLEEVSDNLSYTVALYENGVIAPQKNGSDVIEDYEHNTLSRKFYTNALGNTLPKMKNVNIYKAGQVIKKQIKLSIDNAWNIDNLYVIAFVTNETSKEVLQASEAKLKN